MTDEEFIRQSCGIIAMDGATSGAVCDSLIERFCGPRQKAEILSAPLARNLSALQIQAVLKKHDMQDKPLPHRLGDRWCPRCGCSERAISAFGWDCNI